MAVSEIGVSQPDSTFGKQSRFGDVFTYLLRDIMQFDSNLSDATDRLQTTKRTCDLLFGVGDGKPGFATFRGYQLSSQVCNVYDDQNAEPNQEWHPRLKHTVQWGMDWTCPKWHQKLHEELSTNYGKIDAELTKQKILAHLTSGNLQAVIYDLTDLTVLIS